MLKNLKRDKDVDCRKKEWFKTCLRYKDFDFEEINVS